MKSIGILKYLGIGLCAIFVTEFVAMNKEAPKLHRSQ